MNNNPPNPTPSVTEELKPCPFCGGDDIFMEPDEYGSGGQWVYPIHVGCSRCKVEIVCVNSDTREEAAEAWNTRTAAPQHTGLTDVGRVARAIAPRIFYEFDGETMDRAAKWEAHSESDRETMRLIAQDAITAMQQPACADVERATAWLYSREGGVEFESLSAEDQEHWRKQGREIAALLVSNRSESSNQVMEDGDNG